jgi:signal peptidase II
MIRYTQIAWLMIFGMIILFIDFLTKSYIFNLLPVVDYSIYYPYGGIGVFENFFGIDFSISLAINRGAAWGVFADFQILLLIIRMLIILGMICYLIFLNPNRLADFPLVLIITGAIGNVIDFFLYGFVIDFLHFNLWGYHFPVFNIADTAITIGVIWLFLVASFAKKQQMSKI